MIKLTFEFASQEELNAFLAKLNPVKPVKNKGTAKNDSFDVDPFMFDNEREARIFMDGVYQLMNKYSNVSISDVYDLIRKQSPHGYLDCKYGWRRLDCFKLHIDRAHNECFVTFDKAVELG
jgi:hypothetical protein